MDAFYSERKFAEKHISCNLNYTTKMIRPEKLNTIIFLAMFFSFAFISKILQVFHVKITGIEYILWFCFTGVLFLVNVGSLSRSIIIKQTYFYLLFILIAFCVVNFFFADVTLIRYLQGAFFSFLFAANFILFYNIRFEKKYFYFIANFLILLITIIAAVGYIERIFVPGNYKLFFLRGISTIAKEPSFAASLFNINIILCLTLFMIKKRREYLYVAAISFITITLLLFLKAILCSIIICVVFINIFYGARFRKIFFSIFGFLFLLLMIFLGKPFFKEAQCKFNIYFGAKAEKAPRNALYIAGFKIAKDYFPLGSGQGTFGSYPVGKTYSKIYYKYNLSKVHGLSPDDVLKNTGSHFIFDTYWSHIIGEMGFIATFIYLWLWLFPALKSFPHIISKNTEVKALSFFITLVTINIFIESIAVSMPEQLQFIMIYAGLGAISYKLLFNQLNSTKQAM